MCPLVTGKVLFRAPEAFFVSKSLKTLNLCLMLRHRGFLSLNSRVRFYLLTQNEIPEYLHA